MSEQVKTERDRPEGWFLAVALFFLSMVLLVKAVMEASGTGGDRLISMMGAAPTILLLAGFATIGAVWFLRGKINWPFRKVLALILVALPLSGLLAMIGGATDGVSWGGFTGEKLVSALPQSVVVLPWAALLILNLTTLVMAFRLAFLTPAETATGPADVLGRISKTTDLEPGLPGIRRDVGEAVPVAVTEPEENDEPMPLETSAEEEGTEETELEEEYDSPELVPQVTALDEEPEEAAPPAPHLDPRRILAGVLREEEDLEAPEPLVALREEEEGYFSSEEMEARYARIKAREAGRVTPVSMSPEADASELAASAEKTIETVADAAEEAAMSVTDLAETPWLRGYMDENEVSSEEVAQPASLTAELETEALPESEEDPALETMASAESEALEEISEAEAPGWDDEEEEEFDDEEEYEDEESDDEEYEEDEEDWDDEVNAEDEEDEEYEEGDGEEEELDDEEEYEDEEDLEDDLEVAAELEEPDELEVEAELPEETEEAGVTSRAPAVEPAPAASVSSSDDQLEVAASAETTPKTENKQHKPLFPGVVSGSAPSPRGGKVRSVGRTRPIEEDRLFTHSSDVSDDLYQKASAMVIDEDRCSVAMLQRGLDISFAEATSIIERMSDEGLVGPPLASGRREILTGPSETAGEAGF